MFSIQTNFASLYAQQNLNVNSQMQQTTVNRLSSGYRINSSADDAAGLAVANGLRSQRAELTQGIRNGNDAISQFQIADGGMNNISQILDRMKTLATQSASATFTGDRGTLDTEYQSLLTEIDRQAKNIGFDAGGSFVAAALDVYIGGGLGTNNAQIGVKSESIDLTGAIVDTSATGLNLTGGAIATQAGATTAVAAVQAAVKALGVAQGKIGSAINTVNFAVGLASSQVSNYSASESRIRDADIASEAANLAKASTLNQASMAALAQANQIPQSVLKLLQ